MLMIYGTIWGCMLLAGGSAVVALAWALRRGALSDPHAAAESIFDDDERPPRRRARWPRG